MPITASGAVRPRSLDSLGRSPSLDQLCVDQQDASPRRAKPYQVSVRWPWTSPSRLARQSARDGRWRRDRRPYRRSRSVFKILVVPEQVATRLLGLGHDEICQTDGLGALHVKLGARHSTPATAGVRLQGSLASENSRSSYGRNFSILFCSSLEKRARCSPSLLARGESSRWPESVGLIWNSTRISNSRSI